MLFFCLKDKFRNMNLLIWCSYIPYFCQINMTYSVYTQNLTLSQRKTRLIWGHQTSMGTKGDEGKIQNKK